MSIGVRLPARVDNDGKSLVMKVGPNYGRYEVRVTLNGHDLYDVILFKNNREVWQRYDIFNEMLGEVLLRMESENWG